MKRSIFLPIICLCAFLALFTVVSCDKTKIVEEDHGFDVQSTGLQMEVPDEIKAQKQAIIDRIKNADNPESEIRRINEEHGRYVDDNGDVYFSRADFDAITAARENPNARAGIIYNQLECPVSSIYDATTWYWDNGAYHYLATLNGGSVFVTCPTNWTLCNSYNLYLWSARCYRWDPEDCTEDCGKVYARFLDGTTVKDVDSWNADVSASLHGIGDWWEMRIRDALYSGPCCFNVRSYVLNGDCNGQDTGAGCGYDEFGN